MSRDMVSIKGTRNGLVIVYDPTREFEEIKNTLLSKMESARGFFKGAKFSFLGEHQEIPSHQKTELENICKQYGLVPNTEEPALSGNKMSQAQDRAASVSTPAADGETALLVRRSLRSGQRVVHKGHVVFMGDIHPGAEVVSGGSVLVMGSCRGVVHAGAWGDESARIIARRLAPTVLSIAGWRCPPEITGAATGDYGVARLAGREIVFEQYQTTR